MTSPAPPLQPLKAMNVYAHRRLLSRHIDDVEVVFTQRPSESTCWANEEQMVWSKAGEPRGVPGLSAQLNNCVYC